MLKFMLYMRARLVSKSPSYVSSMDTSCSTTGVSATIPISGINLTFVTNSGRKYGTICSTICAPSSAFLTKMESSILISYGTGTNCVSTLSRSDVFNLEFLIVDDNFLCEAYVRLVISNPIRGSVIATSASRSGSCTKRTSHFSFGP